MSEKHAQERQYERYPVQLACEVNRAGSALSAETQNVSSGGVAIVLSQGPSIGEVVNVSLFLTQDGIEDAQRPPFECAASVRWTKPTDDHRWAAGLQFLSPSSAQTTLLEHFLAQIAD